MKEDRIEFLPDPELDPLRIHLDERIGEILQDLSTAQFRQLFVGPLLSSHLGSAFHAAGSSEGIFWLADRGTEDLVPIYNNGPQAAMLLSDIRHPVTAGLIGMVFSTEQTFCENEIYRNALHSKKIDQTLDVVTCAMIATPVFFAGATRGVLSCVRLKPADSGTPDPPGFTHKELRHIQVAADTLQRLIEHRLYEIVLHGSL